MIRLKTTDERLDEVEGHGAYHLGYMGEEEGQDVWILTLKSGPEHLTISIQGDLWIEEHEGGERLTPAEAREQVREAWPEIDSLDVEAYMKASRGGDGT